jgi:Holliday junction resolvase
MAPRAYAKGARAERRAQRVLEAGGYLTVRSAGSGGLIDVVGIGPAGVRLLSIKAGTARLSALEREALEQLAARVSVHVSVEYWRFPDRARVPIVEILR